MECLVCRTHVQDSGLEFWGVTICSDCEGKLMVLDAQEPEYEVFVGALRSMWQRRCQAFRDRRLKGDDDYR